MDWPLRVGVGVGDLFGMGHEPDEVIGEVRRAAADGFDRAWLAQIPYRSDALTLIAVAGREVPGIELGTAVVPLPPRHPAVLAQQALTVQAAIGGRLVLGVGLSHRLVIEGFYGLSYATPATQTREYVAVLTALLNGRADGMTMDVPGVKAPPPVLLGALGPRMVEIAGSLVDGAITWMTGAPGLSTHVAAPLRRAASAAGRPEPEIVVGLPVCVTGDEADARRRIAERFRGYGTIPAYRMMLDRQGLAGAEDVALIGSEAVVGDAIAALAAAGATELLAIVYGTPDERERTRALLGAVTSP
jgi:5,10-methylenetetrahydromethanopterin reductase